MKKFISALSSVVIAATAMGGSMAFSTDAATNGSVSETIVSIRSNGVHEVTAKAGDKIPVTVYIPQSSGFNAVQLKFAIGKDGNLDETIGQGDIVDRQKTVIKNYKYAFGNYGVKFINKGGDIDGEQVDFVYPNCIESGAFLNGGKGDSMLAGDLKYTTALSMVNEDTWSVLYQAESEIKAGKCVDSYGAWEAAGGEPGGNFDYKNYTPVTTWTKDESWAYKHAFMDFELELPSDMADGVYDFTVYTKEYVNTHPSSLFNDNNEMFPEDQLGKVTSNFNSPDGKKPFSVEKLVIKVGDVETTPAPVVTTEAPVVTTEAPVVTTEAPVVTTEAPVVTTEAPAVTTEPAVTMTAPPENAIIYNLIPSGDDKVYESAQETGKKNNVYKAKAGEKLTVDWTIKNEQGTAGLQMNFDFTQVKFIEGRKGNAYRVNPTFSDSTTSKSLKEGQFIYTWAQSSELKAQDNRVIYSFDIEVPSAPGTYTVGTREGSKDDVNKVVPKNQDAPHTFVFYGLDIVVEGDVTTPAPAETTTEAPATTTVAETTEAPATTTVAETTEAPATTTAAVTTEAPATTTAAVTTEAPAVTTTVAVTTEAPAATTTAADVTTAPAVTTEAPKSGKIVYNLVPNGRDYTAAAAGDRTMNSCVARAGELLQIDWTVKNDLGTAGIQMNLDFSEVKYSNAVRGNAYRAAPTFSDSKNTEGLKAGEVVYTWAQSTELKAEDNSVIYTFYINVPNEEGVYSIGLSKNQNDVNKVVPRHQENPYDFEFHGLEIVVGNPVTTTTPASTTALGETTSAGQTTTTDPTTTSGIVTTDPADANTLYGDVNCDGQIRIGDVVLLNRYLAKNATVSEQGLRNANCEKDDKIDSKDAVKIKKFLALLIKQDELGKKSS